MDAEIAVWEAQRVAEEREDRRLARKDYATASLTGILAGPLKGSTKSPQDLAKQCFRYADAMLEAEEEG